MADEYGPWIAHNGAERPADLDANTTIYAIVHGKNYTDTRCGKAGLYEWGNETAHPIIAYRAKREPVVETVRKPASVALHREVGVWTKIACHVPEPDDAFSDIRLGFEVYETRNGIPDMTTLRWEDAT